MPRPAHRRFTAAIAAGLAAAAVALGGGIALASPAVAASDPAVLSLSLETPWSEDGGVRVTGSCPTGTLGATAVDGSRSVQVLLWPDGSAELSSELYTPGLAPGEVLILVLHCYDTAYSSASGFEGATELGTATQSIANPDHGSVASVAPQTPIDSPLALEFFCGPQGDNANVTATLAAFDDGPDGTFSAQVPAASQSGAYSFGTPAELGIAPGTEIVVGVLCTADVEGEGAIITSQRWGVTLVTAASTPPTAPVRVQTAAAGA